LNYVALFFSSILLLPVCYSYLIYPVFIVIASKSKKNNTLQYDQDTLPKISILMAAHNEELILEKKLESIFSSNYPKEKIELIVGTDCCTDGTNQILEEKAKIQTKLKHVIFKERQGKIRIINQLVNEASHEILVFTDANVLFTENTLQSLVKHFKNKTIGLVDTHMKNYGLSDSGISYPEQSYISLEVKLKEAEGKLWGCMMGPFGGCFAIRKALYLPVPEKYLVDDFHINMNILKQGSLSIHENSAIVHEDVSNHLSAEFNRKVRISAGNFQNLFHFSRIFLKPNRIAFAFLSHKALRWISPFFLSGSFLASLLWFNEGSFNQWIAAGFISILILMVLDLSLKRMNVNIRLLRYITHFTTMNLALFFGFFKFLRGNSNGIWNRTERLQNRSSQ
jgi:cellulose synthase/poly-beta-1,6-N-acetylglucosamine synthase-like glycosyltransferase